MTAARLAQAYRAAAVETVSPSKLILMLYDGALRFLGQALSGFDEEELTARYEIINNNLARAQAIVAELQGSLNMEAGGEISNNLYQLYDFISEQLRQANLKKDRAPILVAQRLLGEVRAGWAEMLQKQAVGA